MPLQSGSSKNIIAANIRELIKAGYKHSQAIAIALDNAGKSKQEASIEDLKNKLQETKEVPDIKRYAGAPDYDSEQDRGHMTNEERCWNGYEPVPGKKAYDKGSCRKEQCSSSSCNPYVKTESGAKYYASVPNVPPQKINKTPSMNIKIGGKTSFNGE
jgi:hypothetical protein